MSQILIYKLPIIYVTVRCNSAQEYRGNLWVISRSLALLKYYVAFLRLRKRIIHQEPQYHTRIILRLVKVFRFVVEVVERKHYQQKEDSYVIVNCLRVFHRFSALILTAKFWAKYNTILQGRIKLFGAPKQWKHFRPLFEAVFLSGGGGGYYPHPPDWVKHHAFQSQDRNNKYFILYIEFCINNKM
jgi:hypothetical protein